MSNAQNAEILTNWSEIRTAGPLIRALTLDQVKDHLRLDRTDTYNDDQLTLLIDSATERVQHDTDSTLISSTFELWGALFPQPSGFIPITRVPVSAIDSIAYTDADDASQTIDSADYVYDESRRMIFPAPGFVWPETNMTSKAIVVSYSAGYSQGAQVPGDLLSAALIIIANLFYGVDVLDTYELIVGRYKRSRYP
jgi:uncharacterized phiE125 gp8 family phage protein